MKHPDELLDRLKWLVLNKEIGDLDVGLSAEEREPIPEKEIILLQEKYRLLGEYLPQVLQARRDLENDPYRKLWAALTALCFPTRTPVESGKLPVPESDGSLSGDIAPIFPLLAQVETAAESYRAHGFSDEEIKKLLASFGGDLAVGERRTGQPGISKSYFRWLTNYATASIFTVGGLIFNFRELPNYVVVLQHAETGKREILLKNRVFNASGMPIESTGQNLPQDAFSAAFAETEDAYYGHPVRGIRCVRALTSYPKTEWSLAIKSGDPVLGVHIPKGADISVPAARRAFSEALTLIRERYPEKHIKALTCNSWLLDPALDTLLPETSKIRAFASLFERFPNKSGGDAPFSFVFDRKMPPEEMPENTTLERALKQYYLDGKFIYFFSGIYLPEDMPAVDRA